MTALSKTYQPQTIEAQIYRQWESGGAFRPAGTGDPFILVLPPPNANADLHCGTALDFQIKDVLARWQRLQGRAVLMIPGADHAGFETWSVYEKHLAGQGRSRFDFGRQELYDQVAEFVQTNRDQMTNQMRRLGISCDWEKFLFSLDDKVVAAAKASFNKMWREDLIYRGRRLVNYCPVHATSFADLEVEHHDRAGQLWQIDYPVVGTDQSVITVATTRPETLLGDTAVAVHPDDQRWQSAVGRSVELPISQRQVPIIADPMVDPEFGTGAVKVTPGHDFADADLGERHQLPVIDLLGDDDRLQAYDWLPAKYHRLSLTDTRQLVIDDLKTAGRLRQTIDHTHRVGCCYKCQTVLEPLRRPQWFVRMAPLANQAIAALEADRIKFYPDRKRQELIAYLRQLQDWNISRQIVWGIPIPVAQNVADPDDWIFDERTERTDLVVNGQTYRPDPDVFDTWWSSGQWPWVSLDWPAQPTGFYPTSLMETGQDILRPWVSRMICLGLYVTNDVPFTAVALHGMVVDKSGVKMSKSKGNVVNPMTIIDQHGADALRLGLMAGLSLGQPQPLGLEKIKAGANFCNKLWNIGRYLQAAVGQDLSPTTKATSLTVADDWIWHQFNQTKAAVTDDLDHYRFGEAVGRVWQFVWHRLADWYVESAKRQANPAALGLIWRQTLRLVHPWTPFVSEALWQSTVAADETDQLIGQQWETMPQPNQARVAEFERLVAVVETCRSLTAKLDPSDKGRLSLLAGSPLADGIELLRQLARLPVEMTTEPPAAAHHWPIEAGRKAEIWLVLGTKTETILIDRLRADRDRSTDELSRLEARLNNPDYRQQAPADLVQASQGRLASVQRELADINRWLQPSDN